MAIKRLAIFDAFETGLKTITIANGFRTNIGLSVLKYRDFSRATVNEMPAIVIGATREDTELTGIGKNSVVARTLTIEYQILISGTDTNSVAIEAVEANSDVEDLIRSDETLAGTALYVVPKDNEFAFADKATSDLVGVLTSSIDVIYRTQYFNPET